MLLNLFIATILSSFSDAENIKEVVDEDAQLNNFRKAWQEFDTEATKLIDIQYLIPLFRNIGSTIGWEKE